MTETIVTNDIFNTPTETPVVVTTDTVLTGTVAELVGEGKKFKTVEALAASVQYKDEFIETLKKEKQALIDKEIQVKASQTFEDLLNNNPVVQSTPTSSGLTPEQITKLLDERIQGNENKKLTEANKNIAGDAVIRHLGDSTKAKEFVANKAIELGLSGEYLATIAATSPTAFLNLVGISGNTNSAPNRVITNSVNTGIENLGSGIKYGTKEYFDNLYKTEGKTQYFSSAVQNEIYKQAQLGVYKT